MVFLPLFPTRLNEHIYSLTLFTFASVYKIYKIYKTKDYGNKTENEDGSGQAVQSNFYSAKRFAENFFTKFSVNAHFFSFFFVVSKKLCIFATEMVRTVFGRRVFRRLTLWDNRREAHALILFTEIW